VYPNCIVLRTVSLHDIHQMANTGVDEEKKVREERPKRDLENRSQQSETAKKKSKGRPFLGTDDSAFSATCRWTGCQEVLATSAAARKHERSHVRNLPVQQPGEEKRSYVCKINNCNSAFASERALAKHLIIHGERKRQCTCGKDFTDYSKLKRHIIQVHSKLHRFVCVDCGYAAYFDEDMAKHVERKKHAKYSEVQIDDSSLDELLASYTLSSSLPGEDKDEAPTQQTSRTSRKRSRVSKQPKRSAQQSSGGKSTLALLCDAVLLVEK